MVRRLQTLCITTDSQPNQGFVSQGPVPHWVVAMDPIYSHDGLILAPWPEEPRHSLAWTISRAQTALEYPGPRSWFVVTWGLEPARADLTSGDRPESHADCHGRQEPPGYGVRPLSIAHSHP